MKAKKLYLPFRRLNKKILFYIFFIMIAHGCFTGKQYSQYENLLCQILSIEDNIFSRTSKYFNQSYLNYIEKMDDSTGEIIISVLPRENIYNLDINTLIIVDSFDIIKKCRQYKNPIIINDTTLIRKDPEFASNRFFIRNVKNISNNVFYIDIVHNLDRGGDRYYFTKTSSGYWILFHYLKNINYDKGFH